MISSVVGFWFINCINFALFGDTLVPSKLRSDLLFNEYALARSGLSCPISSLATLFYSLTTFNASNIIIYLSSIVILSLLGVLLLAMLLLWCLGLPIIGIPFFLALTFPMWAYWYCLYFIYLASSYSSVAFRGRPLAFYACRFLKLMIAIYCYWMCYWSLEASWFR